MIYYEAWSMNPFNHHPARQVKHKTEDCPLLSGWDGKVGKTRHSPKPRCPFCFNKKVLAKAKKAEKVWNLLEPTLHVNFLTSFIEGTTIKRQSTIEREMENF